MTYFNFMRDISAWTGSSPSRRPIREMKQRGPASVREPGVQATDPAASKPADRMLRTSYRLGTAEAKPEGTLNRLNGVKDIKASYPDETVRPASFLAATGGSTRVFSAWKRLAFLWRFCERTGGLCDAEPGASNWIPCRLCGKIAVTRPHGRVTASLLKKTGAPSRRGW